MTGAGMRHYITYRAMITGRPAALVISPQWWGVAWSFVQTARDASIGTGMRRLVEGTDTARVRNELVRRSGLSQQLFHSALPFVSRSRKKADTCTGISSDSSLLAVLDIMTE
jgi:hypothetical protein